MHLALCRILRCSEERGSGARLAARPPVAVAYA